MKIFGTILPSIHLKKEYYFTSLDMPEVMQEAYVAALEEAGLQEPEVTAIATEALYVGWLGKEVKLVIDVDILVNE